MRNVTRLENHPRISWCFFAARMWGTDFGHKPTPSHARTLPNVGKPQTQGSNHRPKRKVLSRKRNLPESHVYMIDLTAQIDTLNFNEYTISHKPRTKTPLAATRIRGTASSDYRRSLSWTFFSGAPGGEAFWIPFLIHWKICICWYAPQNGDWTNLPENSGVSGRHLKKNGKLELNAILKWF